MPTVSEPPRTVPRTFSDWTMLTPEAAAAEIRRGLEQLPAPLRRAAVAWVPAAPDLEESFRRTDGGPLRGIPFFAKDLFDVAGVPTFAGSTFLPQVRPTPGDSALVARLRRLGAVLAGKSHLVEFASGLTGENPHYGDCPHPQHPDRLSGGSSSGSAALVGAGVVPLALGTDTGGSIRIPASFCGIYGFRLTPGDAFIRDAFPLAPTMDTAGWFTANAGDMHNAWQDLTGGTSGSGSPRGCYLPGKSLLPGIDPETETACARAAANFGAIRDAATEARLIEAWRDAVDAYLIVGMSEAHTVHRAWLVPYRDSYDPVIWQRFTDAGKLPSARITQARETFTSVRESWYRYFQEYDYLVLPAAPFPALRKADCTPGARRSILTLTAPASLGGLSCLTVPVSLSNGLTVGLQFLFPRPDSPAVAALLSLANRRSAAG